MSSLVCIVYFYLKTEVLACRGINTVLLETRGLLFISTIPWFEIVTAIGYFWSNKIEYLYKMTNILTKLQNDIQRHHFILLARMVTSFRSH